MKKGARQVQKTGVIGGTSLLDSRLFSGYGIQRIKTRYGSVTVRTKGDVVFLQRHGEKLVPPHMINHRANIRALKQLNVDRIFAINSTGSLKRALVPGSFLIPDDFVCPWQIPTYFDNEMKFTVPDLDGRLSKTLANTCRELGIDCRCGGTYIQTTGPRFETKAEIRMLRNYGDVIGMTMASEATLSMEQQIPYASLCSIDNFCNGIARKPLSIQQITDNMKKNIQTIEQVVHALVSRGIE